MEYYDRYISSIETNKNNKRRFEKRYSDLRRESHSVDMGTTGVTTRGRLEQRQQQGPNTLTAMTEEKVCDKAEMERRSLQEMFEEGMTSIGVHRCVWCRRLIDWLLWRCMGWRYMLMLHKTELVFVGNDAWMCG